MSLTEKSFTMALSHSQQPGWVGTRVLCPGGGNVGNRPGSAKEGAGVPWLEDRRVANKSIAMGLINRTCQMPSGPGER